MTDLYQENKKLIEAWMEASKDLGIKIETPFFMQTKNEKIKYDLLIKKLGSEIGTLVITRADMSDFHKAQKHGLYCSALNPFYLRQIQPRKFY